MSGVEWGPPIEVAGVRPAWLASAVRCAIQQANGGAWIGLDAYQNAAQWVWPPITSIRLPASHFAYLAIAKGFEPWGGGDSAPEDWDGGDALLSDGSMIYRPFKTAIGWRHGAARCDIIGYNKREQSCECFDCNVGAHAQPSPADTVTVKRMTQAEAEAFGLARGYDGFNGADGEVHYYGGMRDLGLIREPTKSERIAAKTGLTVEQVQSVLNEVE